MNLCTEMSCGIITNLCTFQKWTRQSLAVLNYDVLIHKFLIRHQTYFNDKCTNTYLS